MSVECEECDVAVEADVECQWCLVPFRAVADEDSWEAERVGEPCEGVSGINAPGCP